MRERASDPLGTALHASIETIKRKVYAVAFPLIGVALLVFTVVSWRSQGVLTPQAWGFPLGLTIMGLAMLALVFRWLPLRWIEYGLLGAAIGGLVGLMAYTGFGPDHADSEALLWVGYWLPVVYGFVFMVFGMRTGAMVSILVYVVALASGVSHLYDLEHHSRHEMLMMLHTYLSNVVIIAVLIGVATILRRQARHSDRLEEEVHTDVLTGLPNRRFLSHLIVDEMARTERYNRPFAIVLFDLDHFKLVNDHYGHPTGDEVLKGIGPLLERYIRDTDTLGRWGGEEFLVLLPEMDVPAASRMAERLREVIEDAQLVEGIDVTASFGVARFRKGESMAELLERVDRALYTAKDAGRNRVFPPAP